MDTDVSKPANGRHLSWVPLNQALSFLFRHPRLLGWSLLLVIATGGLTWLGYLLTVDLLEQFTTSHFNAPPAADHFWKWPLIWGWKAAKWLFIVLSRVIAFYLAFLAAYCVTTPGYVILSNWAGDSFCDTASEGQEGFTFTGMVIDMREGVKIGAVGLLVTVAALLVNFIPGIGQLAVFLLYVGYSSLMLIDFPASRYRWPLGQKCRWLYQHLGYGFRLGLLPALMSMIPVVNIFLMALMMPLFTVHTTLNFLAIKRQDEQAPLAQAK